MAGGVGANKRLREKLGELARRQGLRLYFPRHEFCTDNAAMIAAASSPTTSARRAGSVCRGS